MTRVAVVDVGTNSTRLYIADVDDGRIVDEITRQSRVTRLGAGVDASGTLAGDALEREHTVLSDYADQIGDADPDVAVAVMTSAVRDASNGPAFARDTERRHGWSVHVLTGEQEAALTYRGATDDLPDTTPRQRVLVVDIGGGSTELVIGTGPEPDFYVSTQAGVVRQADRHVQHDPPTDGELAQVADDVRETLERAVPPEQRTGIDRAIAVAGTPTSLAAIAQELEPYDSSRVHGYVITTAVRDGIFARLRPMPLEQRRQVAGLHPERAVTMLPGIVILAEVMRLFGLDSVEASEHDILRGAAVSFARTGSDRPRP